MPTDVYFRINSPNKPNTIRFSPRRLIAFMYSLKINPKDTNMNKWELNGSLGDILVPKSIIYEEVSKNSLEKTVCALACNLFQ